MKRGRLVLLLVAVRCGSASLLGLGSKAGADSFVGAASSCESEPF